MKIFSKVLVVVAMSAMVVAANGQAKKAAPKAATCPVCHMPLSAKKTAANPTAVRLTKKGKVLYCCAGCKMPASVLVKPAKKK